MVQMHMRPVQACNQRNMGNLCSKGLKEEESALTVHERCDAPSYGEPGSIADTWHHICKQSCDEDAVQQLRCEDHAVPMTFEPLQPGFPRPLVMGAHGRAHTASVILLHGLGDTAHGWSDHWGTQLCSLRHCKWVLPTAPTVRFLLRHKNQPVIFR